ncbi:MAG: hypothetical protein ACRDR6_24485 [Pseudonocardiaceae bacterium]
MRGRGGPIPAGSRRCGRPRVALRTPPGETAIMTWTATEELRRLLAFAVARVLHDGTT